MKYEIEHFEFEQNRVRSVLKDGEPWFVLSDICKALDLTTPARVAQRLDEDERSVYNLGRQGEAIIINESGLYAVILRSNKPEARKFRKWITWEVLPSLRKTGSYLLSNAPEAELLRELQRTNQKLDILIAQNQQKNSKKRLPTDSGMPDAEKLMIIETITELAREGEKVSVFFPEMHEIIRKKYGSDFFPPRPTAFLKALEPELREKGIILLNIGKKIRRKEAISKGFVIVTSNGVPDSKLQN